MPLREEGHLRRHRTPPRGAHFGATTHTDSSFPSPAKDLVPDSLEKDSGQKRSLCLLSLAASDSSEHKEGDSRDRELCGEGKPLGSG